MKNLLAEMTIEQLEAALTHSHGEIKDLKARKKQVARVLELRYAEASVRRRLEGMTEVERAAMAQLISGAGGIPSGEAPGTPGL